jgi:hypothetical protein
MVPTGLVDLHSTKCTQVIRQLIVAENADALTEVDFKLERLRLNVEDSIRRTEAEHTNRSVFERILALTAQVLGMSIDNLEGVHSTSEFLQCYIRDFDGPVCHLLYLERLYFLTRVPLNQTKLRELQLRICQNSENSLIDELKSKSRELEAYKLEAEHLREMSQRLQAMLNSPLEQSQESIVKSCTESP